MNQYMYDEKGIKYLDAYNNVIQGKFKKKKKNLFFFFNH